MAQIENVEILGTILKSTLGVISRRTSEPYANMILEKVLADLGDKYDFLKKVKIEKDRFNETIDVIDLDYEINDVSIDMVASAIRDFMIRIANLMGKDAGFYFIKEIKEDIPYEYENKIKEIGVDLELIQSEFITEVKTSFKTGTNNSEILKHVFTVLYEIIEKESGRKSAYEILNDLIIRLSTQYEALNYVKVNDVISIQNVDIISVEKEINSIDKEEIGATIQKIVQEVLLNYDEKETFLIMEKIRNQISAEYCQKLKEIGVNFDAIKLKHTLLIKKVLRNLLDILSESSTKSYAILVLNNIMKKFSEKFDFLNLIKINSLQLSEGIDAIEVSSEINSISPIEIGRAIQKIMENVSTSLGEEAGSDFLDMFKKRMGKAYILRMEEIGVNLHMIELRRNLL